MDLRGYITIQKEPLGGAEDSRFEGHLDLASLYDERVYGSEAVG